MRKYSWILLFYLVLIPFLPQPAKGEGVAWHILINIPEYRLHLYQGETLYQSYFIAVGKPGKPSPTGNFWIANKLTEPTWYPPDGKPPVPPGPRNPLGKYWMGLNVAGYGIHGNSAAWSIGTPASQGCFRMNNQDIKTVFSLVPVGTEVKITYNTVISGLEPASRAWLEIYSDIYQRRNQELAVKQAIEKLNWEYQPHQQALQQLIQLKKPIRFLIPRVIQIEGDSSWNDGFYWNGQIYLATNNSVVTGTTSSPLNIPFNGYSVLSQSTISYGEPEVHSWNELTNTLKVHMLKLFLDGQELTDAVRLRASGELWLDLKKVANSLGKELIVDPNYSQGVIEGLTVEGETQDDYFWVKLNTLVRVFPGLRSKWDESTGKLKLNWGVIESTNTE